jgi:hypothetical protein
MKKWTNEEIEFLQSNYNKEGVGYCVEYLERT